MWKTRGVIVLREVRQLLIEAGFQHQEEGYVFSRIYPPIKNSDPNRSWELIIVLTEANNSIDPPSVIFDIINPETQERIPSKELENEGFKFELTENMSVEDLVKLLKDNEEKLDDSRYTAILMVMAMMVNVFEYEVAPFFKVGDLIRVKDSFDTRVVAIDIDDFSMVAVKPIEGLLQSTGVLNKLRACKSVHYKRKGSQYTWIDITDLRSVI